MLGDELFNVQHIERYYKEDVPKSSSFDVFMFHNVRGYMKAVNQLIKITAPPKESKEVRGRINGINANAKTAGKNVEHGGEVDI